MRLKDLWRDVIACAARYKAVVNRDKLTAIGRSGEKRGSRSEVNQANMCITSDNKVVRLDIT